MNISTVAIGVIALGFGIYTILVRVTNPSRLEKLEAMKKSFGEKPGLIVHVIAYSILPVVFGILLIVRGYAGMPIL